jgi:hypothetical protein
MSRNVPLVIPLLPLTSAKTIDWHTQEHNEQPGHEVWVR